jgi:hypothetical protein
MWEGEREIDETDHTVARDAFRNCRLVAKGNTVRDLCVRACVCLFLVLGGGGGCNMEGNE